MNDSLLCGINHDVRPLTVPPKINDNASTPINPQVVLNRTIILNCDVSGTPTPTIEWLVDGRPLNPGPRFRLLSDNRQLEIVEAQVPDQARYTCIAKNPAGVANRDFDLDVLGTYPVMWCVVGDNNPSTWYPFSQLNNVGRPCGIEALMPAYWKYVIVIIIIKAWPCSNDMIQTV